MVGFAADGANVMFGEHNSVAARFKEDIPGLFVLKCVCHSLALGVSHAVKELPPEVEEFLSNAYCYLKYSSKRQEAFRTIQELLELPGHKLLQYKKVRWLSLHAAVSRFLDQYDALFKFFEKEASLKGEDGKKARDIFGRTRFLWNKLYLNFLNFVLPIVNQRNVEFQSTKPKIHKLYSKMETLFRTISHMYLISSYVDLMDIEDLDFSLSKENEQNLEPLRKMDLGPDVTAALMYLSATIPVSDIDKFRGTCRQFLVSLLRELYKRFPFRDGSVKLLRQLEFVEPSILKETKNIHGVAQFFGLSLENVNNEFRKLKDMFRYKYDTEMYQFWSLVKSEVRSDGSLEFPLLLSLVERVLVLPHASANVERVFSQINLNKTKMRNSLETETLCGLLHGKELIKGRLVSEINVEPLLPLITAEMYA